MERRINIKYPDGTVHEVIPYSVDTTEEGLLILSYYDITNGGYCDSYTPITNINGIWYKVPEHRNWEEYHFVEHNEALSIQIISELSNNMESYTPEKQAELEFIKQQKESNKPRFSTVQAVDDGFPPTPPKDSSVKETENGLYLYNYKLPDKQSVIMSGIIHVHVLETELDNIGIKGMRKQSIFIEYERPEKQSDGSVITKYSFFNLDALSEEQFDTNIDQNIQYIQLLTSKKKDKFRLDQTMFDFRYYDVEDENLSLNLNRNNLNMLIVNRGYSHSLSRGINATLPMQGFNDYSLVYDNGVEFISTDENDYSPTFIHHIR